MSITRFHATWIGSHAHQYLAGASWSGTVDSTFGEGINVLIDGEPEPGLVSIQIETAPLHPWAVIIHRRIQTSAKASVVAQSNQIRLDQGATIIDLSNAHIERLSIHPWIPERIQQARHHLQLVKRAVFDECARTAPDLFQARIQQSLDQWRQTGETSHLSRLIGLGRGSTPDGDDTLVGILAGLTAQRNDRQAACSLRALRDELRAAPVRQMTVPFSAQMIGAALDGAFPEALRDLVEHLADSDASDDKLLPRIRRVRSLGASSGCSLLRGLIAAMETVREPKS